MGAAEPNASTFGVAGVPGAETSTGIDGPHAAPKFAIRTPLAAPLTRRVPGVVESSRVCAPSHASPASEGVAFASASISCTRRRWSSELGPLAPPLVGRVSSMRHTSTPQPGRPTS